MNITYHYACLTKIALITGLIFVALAVILTNYSFGNPAFHWAPPVQSAEVAQIPFCFLGNTLDILHEQTGKALSVDNEASPSPRMAGEATLDSRVTPSSDGLKPSRGLGAQNFACPRSVAPPSESAYPKESIAEMYARLIEEHVPPFREPPCLPGNTHQARNQELWGEKH